MALKRSDAALLPQGRLHFAEVRFYPVEADVEGGAAGPAPQKAAAEEAAAPSLSRPTHKCARSRSSADGVGAILARRLIKG